MARFQLLLATVLGLLLLAPVAHGASRSAIIRDCEDDSKLSGTYTATELRDARSNLPSDKDAYSDCRDVLSAALAASAARTRAQTGGTGSSAGNALEGGASGTAGGSAEAAGTPEPPAPSLDVAPGAGPVQATPAEIKSLDQVRTAPGALGKLTGVRAVAGKAATATVPTSLILVLVLLGVTVVLAAVPYARRRVLRRRTP